MKCNLEPDAKPKLDPTSPTLARDVAIAIQALGLIDLGAAIANCTDSGILNGGDGGGHLVIITTVNPHGLGSGDHVVLSGTPYDGEREVEVADASSFFILNIAFTAPSTGGEWRPAT